MKEKLKAQAFDIIREIDAHSYRVKELKQVLQNINQKIAEEEDKESKQEVKKKK